jgi:hypothetical protein
MLEKKLMLSLGGARAAMTKPTHALKKLMSSLAAQAPR